MFLAATVVGIVALLALLYNVINESFGYVAYQNQADPETLILDYYKGQMLAAPRKVASEDDEKLVEGVKRPSNGARLLRLRLLQDNTRRLKLLAVDGVRLTPRPCLQGHTSWSGRYTSTPLPACCRRSPQVAAFLQLLPGERGGRGGPGGLLPAPAETLAAAAPRWTASLLRQRRRPRHSAGAHPRSGQLNRRAADAACGRAVQGSRVRRQHRDRHHRHRRRA